MSGGGGQTTTATTWQAVAASVLALWLLPAVLALAILWLPLLCCAVAAVRFRRARAKQLARGTRSSRGFDGGDGGVGAREDATVGASSRLRLLHQYLDDQMELVGGGAQYVQEQS